MNNEGKISLCMKTEKMIIKLYEKNDRAKKVVISPSNLEVKKDLLDCDI